MKKVSVSILSSKNVQKDIIKLNSSKADYIHIDVCDGHFVKNRFNPYKTLYKLYPETTKRLDVHLMDRKPKKNINRYASLNTEYITVHVEIDKLDKYIDMIKQYGIKVGLAINPETDIELLKPYLHTIDLIIIMSVHPGLGGQEFLEDTPKRVLKIKKMIVEEKVDVKITVDGGVNDEKAKELEFADIIVSGSYVIKSDNYDERIELIRENANRLQTKKRTVRRKIKEENIKKKKKKECKENTTKTKKSVKKSEE